MLSIRCCGYAALLVAGFTTISGCGESGPKMAPVEGTVTMDGKPLEKVLVEFWPEAPGPRSIGETDAAGHFKLSSDDGKRDGAVVSTHKVILKDTMIFEGRLLGRAGENVDQPPPRKPRFGGKFTQSQTTPITQIVEAGKKNDFAIVVGK